MKKNTCLVLLVALCLTQELSARSVRISDDDNIKTLNKLINKLEKSVENIEEVVQTFDKKTQEDLNHLLPEIIADLEKKLEEIAEEANASLVVLINCLVEAQPALRDLEFVATKGFQYCLIETNKTKNEITKKFIEVNEKATTVISNITGGILECLNHPVDEIKYCFRNLVKPSIEEVNVVLKEIQLTIRESKKLIENANTNFYKCVDKVEKEIANIEDEILENFQKCVTVEVPH